VIKGNDGVIRRYATHGATENLPAGTRVAQGQRIGTVARGHVHYEEIIPTINGKPNPVYQEFERNASSNTFTSTSYQHGVIDPSGPQGSLRNIGTGSLQSSKVSEHTKFGPTTPEQRGFLTSPTGKISVTHIPVRNREDAGLPSSFLNPTSFKHIPAESLKKPDSTLPFTKVANMEHQDKPHESGHVGPGETKTLHSAWTHKAILIRNETSHNNVDYHPKDQSPPNPAKVADEAWSGPPIDPVGKGVTPQPHGGPPSGLAHILGGQPVTASSDVGSLPKHVRGVVKAIGTSETDYNINEAYKDKYNQTTGKDKNMNVIKEGERGKDYGFFQNNQSQVERGIALGMPYEEAQHLMGGTKGQVSTKEQQEVAMGHYLQLTRADEMKKLLMTHDFDATRKALSNEWFALERPNAIAGAKKAYESQQ
jgi:hypothetical protein